MRFNGYEPDEFRRFWDSVDMGFAHYLDTAKKMNVEVELQSELCRGRTVVDLWRRTDRPANAEVGVGIDTEAFFDLLFERLAALG